MSMNYKVLTLPTFEPVTLQAVKDHLKINWENEDSLLSQYISASRDEAETYTGFMLCKQLIEQRFDSFHNPFLLAVGNVKTIDSIDYVDQNGQVQELDSSFFVLSTFKQLPEVSLAPGKNWPETNGQSESVRIKFWAGEEEATTIKQSIKGALLAMIADREDNRTDYTRRFPTAAYMILDTIRVRQFV